jgi:hypothetical protein
MEDKVIPDIVARFLLEKVESIVELEGLLILHRDPRKKWDARALADRLYVREEETEAVLRALCDRGLAGMEPQTPPQYFYQPETPELGAAVDLLEKIYSRHIVPVTNLIHSKAKHKIQRFADAFRFRKED